jgi:hypothetical protein
MGFQRASAGLAAAFLVSFAPLLHAQGISPTTVTLNEDGTGSAVTGNSTVIYTGVNQQDPGPGGLSNALVFNVGTSPLLVSGDLFLIDPTTFAISDIIRFNNMGGVDQIVFYSRNDGDGAKADTGFPGGFYANDLDIFENPNGPTTYTPTTGQPGFIDFGGLTYVINSAEAVPEPSTFALVTLPAIGFICSRLGCGRRRV